MTLLSALILSALPAPQVDLVMGPNVKRGAIGQVVELELTASATTPESVSGIDAILSWDPARLDFIEAGPGSFSWFVSGFLTDPDGINANVTDGEALYTALAPAAAPATLPPDIVVATFRFRVLAPGKVSLKPSSGMFGKTRVLSTVPGVEITGSIAAKARVRVKVAPESDPGPVITHPTNFSPLVAGSPGPRDAHGLAFADRGRRLAVLTSDASGARATLVDRRDGRLLASRELPPFAFRSEARLALAFEPSGRWLAVTTPDGSLVLDAWTLEPLVELPGVALAHDARQRR